LGEVEFDHGPGILRFPLEADGGSRIPINQFPGVPVAVISFNDIRGSPVAGTAMTATSR
jgi:hypothetical protein